MGTNEWTIIISNVSIILLLLLDCFFAIINAITSKYFTMENPKEEEEQDMLLVQETFIIGFISMFLYRVESYWYTIILIASKC